MKVLFLLLTVPIFMALVESKQKYGSEDYGNRWYGRQVRNGAGRERGENIITPRNGGIPSNDDRTSGSSGNTRNGIIDGNTRTDNNGGNTLIDNDGSTTDNGSNGGDTRNDNNDGERRNDNSGGNKNNDNNGGDTRNDNNNTIDTTTGDMTGDDGNMTIDDLFPNGDDVIPVDDVDGNIIIDDIFGNIIDGNDLQTTQTMNNRRQNTKQSDKSGMKDKKRMDKNGKSKTEHSNNRKTKPYDRKYNHKTTVTCQAGFFLKFGKCRPCPTGFFQPKPGKTYCKRCPRGKTTRMEGTRALCQCFDPRKKTKKCIKTCHGLSPGDYQSCLGCHFYASCIGGFYIIDGRKCPAYLEWDDNCKRCEYKSNTCRHNKKKYSGKYDKTRKSGYSKKSKYNKP